MTIDVTRREAVRRIAALLGTSMSAPTVAGLLAGCRPPASGTNYRPRSLSDQEMHRVETIAEIILPETDTPGASAAHVHEFVDMMVTEFYSAAERQHFLDGLARVDAHSIERFGQPFADADPADQVALIAALDAEAFPEDAAALGIVTARAARGDPPFMRTMKELTISGYYTSEIGQTVELHVPPFGSFEGDLPLARVGRAWA